MASITAVTASPTSVAKGGTSRVVPSITNTDRTVTVTVGLDGSTGTAPITIRESLTWSANPSDAGKPGFVVATVDQGGTLAVGADGVSFTFTAS